MMDQSTPEIRIRPARVDDAPAMLAIFAIYIREGTVSFEYNVPTVSDFQEKIIRVSSVYPFLVAVVDDTPVGYCCAGRFRGQAAYDWAVETTIYLLPAWHGRGIGRKLYNALEAALKRQNVMTMYACISAAHKQSVGFHRHMGYLEIARFHGVGYKMGEWLDIIWMEKRLNPLPANPQPFIPFSHLIDGENA